MKIILRKEWVGSLIVILVLLGLLLLKPKTEVVTQVELPEIAQETIQVYITGEVNTPGVYAIEEGQRLERAISLAGGFTQSADITGVNLARKLSDGEMVMIYPIGEKTVAYVGVDLFNYGNLEEIVSIDGIGQVIGERIVKYRESHGHFNSFEDLLSVEGIGEGKLKTIVENTNRQ